MAAAAVYRVKGSTNDVTTCEECGRDELRGTVVLAVLDVDGNDTGDVVHMGSGCAATAGKTTVQQVRAEARAADSVARRREQERQEAETAARIVARDRWIAENVGADALDHPRKYGYRSTVHLCVTALDAIAAGSGEE